MNRRDDFITAYQAMFGVTKLEADRTLRDVELACAEQQNTELTQAIDTADGERVREVAALRGQNAVLQTMLETIPGKHMRFGLVKSDGSHELFDKCADWCYACKLERLQSEVNEWKTHEAAARGACLQLAQMQEHSGSVLGLLQSGEYDKAITVIQTREERRRTRVGRTVISVVAVEDNYGKLDCCDEEEFHLWVMVLTWTGRRAYITGATPFMEAAGSRIPDVYSLKDEHFLADLPREPPPAVPEPGEHLEWPNLELAPPIEEIERRLGIN